MGACINQKPKPKGKGHKAREPDMTKSKSKPADALESGSQQPTLPKEAGEIIPNKKARRRLQGDHFAAMYRVEENVGTTARMEGPKFISNFSDGSGKVMRIVPFIVHEDSEEVQNRVGAFAEICGLEVFQDEESNLVIFQEFYCGPTVDQVPPEHLPQFLIEVYDIIASFHLKNVVLGNLNVFSFRQTSEFDPTARLVDLNLTAVSNDKAMGHAHKNEREMDWEAYGYLLQLVLSKDPPIFIPHKLQYMEAFSPMVNDFLRGKKVAKENLSSLPVREPHEPTVLGYRFRNDIIKLIKLRKRRVQHRGTYYSPDIFDDSNHKVGEEVVHRLETQRILARIEGYAGGLTKDSEEAFMMYSEASDKFKRLKPAFIEKEVENKMAELKEALPLLK